MCAVGDLQVPEKAEVRAPMTGYRFFYSEDGVKSEESTGVGGPRCGAHYDQSQGEF